MAHIFSKHIQLNDSPSVLGAAFSWLSGDRGLAQGELPGNLCNDPRALVARIIEHCIPQVNAPVHVWQADGPGGDADGQSLAFKAECAFHSKDIGALLKRCAAAAHALGAISVGGFVFGLEDARGHVHEFVGGPTEEAVVNFHRARRIEDAMAVLDPQADSDLIEYLGAALASLRPQDAAEGDDAPRMRTC